MNINHWLPWWNMLHDLLVFSGLLPSFKKNWVYYFSISFYSHSQANTDLRNIYWLYLRFCFNRLHSLLENIMCTVHALEYYEVQHISQYCKKWEYLRYINFRVFRANSASANSKTRENICNTLYAHFGHVGVVYGPYVLMQMGYILKSVWDLLCFCAAQLHTYM